MDSPIQTEIKRRKIYYYAVTRDELISLSEKNTYGDIFSVIASLSLSALLTSIFTKKLSVNLVEESLELLNIFIGISLILLLISLFLVIIFKLKHGRKIKEIIGDKPVQYTVKEVDEEVNPDYFTGDKRIIMNISLKHKIKFKRLFKSKKDFEKLKTNEHSNSHKKRLFHILNNKWK
jgi:hypothetical protein